jgi:putative methionine-R-sulfoxide reductase with GAF domain
LENFLNFLIQQKEIKFLMTNLETRLITDFKEIKFIGFYLERETKITKQEPLGIVFKGNTNVSNFSTSLNSTNKLPSSLPYKLNLH